MPKAPDVSRRTPDLSSTREETVGDFLAPTPTPEEVEERLEIEDERTVAQHELDLRDRETARRWHIPYKSWQKLDARTRANITATPPDDDEGDDVDEGEVEQPKKREFPEVSERQLASITSSAQFDALARSLIPLADRKSHTLMCDPPIEATVNGTKGQYHPGVSKIRLEAVSQKAKQGFTINPKHPFLPDPQVRCPMDIAIVSGLSATSCPYKGRTDDEVEAHMRATHPDEYSNRLRRLERERSEALLREQQAMVALMRQQMAATKE